MTKLKDYPNSKLYWFGGWIYDFTKIATIVVFVLLIVHYFFFTVFIVDGVSMDKTLLDKDVMLVNRIGYKYDEIKRGDIISLYFPGEEQKKFVKRVVGLPGETIKIANGRVFINEKNLDEPYLNGALTKPDFDVKLEDNEYFVMGDNRELSSDSRVWGPLPKNYIIGKAIYRLFNTIQAKQNLKNDVKTAMVNIKNFRLKDIFQTIEAQ